MVQISPQLLEFHGPVTETLTEQISITNDSAETVAFKVKTTAPRLYCVRPNAATLQPGETVEVSVISLGKKDADPSYESKDKFLIVTLPSPYPLGEESVADVWSKLEAEFKSQAVSQKIKVAFVEQKEQPKESIESPVLAQDSSAAQNVTEKVSGSTSDIAGDDLSNEDRSKIDALNKKLDSNTTGTIESSQETSTEVTAQRPITLSTVLLFALIAFIIGWLFY